MARKKQKPDVSPIADFVRVWDRDEAARSRRVVEHGDLMRAVGLLESAIRRKPPRSSVLVGEPGVGKTAAILALGKRLRSRGWILFEASASELMSGQTFIGQIDERVKDIADTAAGDPRILWICPSFHELVWAGRHIQSPVGVLEKVLPFLESGSVRIIGETTPGGWDVAVQAVPRLRTAIDAVRISPLDRDTTIEIAVEWTARVEGPGVESDLVHEAAQLADQFPAGQQNPGRLLGLLGACRERVTATTSSEAPIRHDDVVRELSVRTGIPVELLDDRQRMKLEEVRGFFDGRVLGQAEAVGAIVDRIALIKSGLTDPSRPQGVFLFVGPTGTGKTELAKTLAAYLFGSPDRLVRLDMSELQDAQSVGRILGEPGPSADPNSLVTLVRQQPFCVVLLDEFEKAHPNVWDLFLPLFDDGRLTGRDGVTADFRSAIVIMTSNLGSSEVGRPGLGFGGGPRQLSTGGVHRAMEEVFRPEFINRIDRVLTFRPLSRPVMRKLLTIELSKVFERRGLRRRGWAVEWEEAALDFLLERGFSETLGARPLRRAVEQLFLAPLAEAIVEHTAPEGEQFLFVRREGERIAVEFVDPDEDQTLADDDLDGRAPDGGAVPLGVGSIALAGVGRADEIALLQREYERLDGLLADTAWEGAKDGRLASMSEGDFWERPDRFEILGRIEYMDRIETGLETAGSLLRRLRQYTGESKAPFKIVRRLAEQLYLVGEAIEELESGSVGEVFLMVRGTRDPSGGGQPSDAFARQLLDMYRRWSDKRRMKSTVLQDGAERGQPHRAILAVSGFGAFRILTGEHGHHVLEVPREAGGFQRTRAVVAVARQPFEPLPERHHDARAIALALLREAGEVPSGQIVRRYRTGPAPLVRDSVRGWRSGNLDQVLGGDFDLIA